MITWIITLTAAVVGASGLSSYLSGICSKDTWILIGVIAALAIEFCRRVPQKDGSL